MKDSNVAVHVSDLRKCYGGMFSRRVHALQGVSFDVPKGKVFGLLGPNGAGKTTIIKILLGIIRASGGSAKLLGQQAGKRFGRRNVGYLPENLQVPPHQTALTALQYYGQLSGMEHSAIKRRGAELLERVGLQGRQKESIRQYSKGMRQRLGLAQALLHDPELLILDEPTDGLDPVGRSQVRDIMQELSDQGKTVFLNSHILQEVELICDQVAILNHGQLKYTGSVEEFTAASDKSELELELDADHAKTRSALPERKLEFISTDAESRTRLRMKISGQLDVDQTVDALRGNSISILSMTRRKRTLEDVFLDIVNQVPYQA